MSLRYPEAQREMPWLDSLFWSRQYLDENMRLAVVLFLEKQVSTNHLDRLLAVLAFRGPGNLAAFMSFSSKQRAPNYPSSFTYHSNVMFFGPSMLCLWRGEMSVGSGEHQHEG